MDELYDQSGTVVAVCAFFLPVCTLVTGLRLWVRWKNDCLGIDDYTFFAGLILWIVSTTFAILACWNGLGAHVGRYTPEQGIIALRWYCFFQDFYIWSNIPIKSSLCLTLIRISNQTWISYVLYFIIFVVSSSSIGTNIYLQTNCTPFDARWNHTLPGATCRSATGTVELAIIFSAINIIVDWTVALLPVFILWRVQMPRKQKLSAMAILACGIFASSATVIRLRSLQNFTDVHDYLYGLAPLVKWTTVELGLAFIAGSTLTWRPLFRRWFGTASRKTDSTPRHGFRSMVRNDAYLRTASHDSPNRMEIMVNGGDRDGSGDADDQRSITDKDIIQVTKTLSHGLI
ncbi:hypothetical protein BJ170DRAFT_103775 [Xylariales sp. AK1849]|nr:hypothetical protein BJ170DRAFT_103775 [Xylariales sp. AK1849]